MDRYRRWSAVLLPVVAVLLVAVWGWGYRADKLKTALLLKAENQYQLSFHELGHDLDRLHTELGNALAVHANSHSYQKRCLINIWRLTSQAQSEVGRLPLAMLPVQQTDEFLARVARFAYDRAIRDFDREPLSDGERRTLEQLYKQSGQIRDRIRELQENVITGRWRWVDLEKALAANPDLSQNAIADGFKALDRQVREFSSVDLGPTSKSFEPRTLNALAGPEVSADDIRRKAARFLQMAENEASALEVVENGPVDGFRTYTVTRRSSDGVEMLDYTRKGGQLIRYLHDRPIGDRTLSGEEAGEIAWRALEENGFSEVAPVSYDEYDNVAVFTYAAERGGVVYYPERLTARVALDNGELVGLEAVDWLTEKKGDVPAAPVLSREEAAKLLHPEFRVQTARLAVIRNESGQDVLCHEFDGVIQGMRMRVFLNASTGVEEKVEAVKA